MERLQSQNPFPEIKELKEALPETGIAFHGTTTDNAETIQDKGFKIKQPRFANINFLHFFYIPQKGSGYTNSQECYNGFLETLHWAYLRGNVHGTNSLEKPSLVIFQPNLAESEITISDNPEKRFENGHPIWVKTKRTDGHKIIGISDYVIKSNGLIDVSKTVEKMTMVLKNEANSFSKPLLPALK